MVTTDYRNKQVATDVANMKLGLLDEIDELTLEEKEYAVKELKGTNIHVTKKVRSGLYKIKVNLH